MKTTKSSAPKKGTIGYAVAKLVAKYAHYPAGLSILEMALEQATKARSVCFHVGNVTETCYLTQTPGYKAAVQAELECYSRMGFFTYDVALNVAKKYVDGKCLAIRFAPGVTAAEMESCIKARGAESCDWQPYNEATNEFLG